MFLEPGRLYLPCQGHVTFMAATKWQLMGKVTSLCMEVAIIMLKMLSLTQMI